MWRNKVSWRAMLRFFHRIIPTKIENIGSQAHRDPHKNTDNHRAPAFFNEIFLQRGPFMKSKYIFPFYFKFNEIIKTETFSQPFFLSLPPLSFIPCKASHFSFSSTSSKLSSVWCQRKTWCMGPYHAFDYNQLTPESTTTHLPWATEYQSRPQPYARVNFILQLGT
jgi:hypothetical protein